MLSPQPLPRDLLARWSEWFAKGDGEAERKIIRANTKCGRPCGSRDFIGTLEQMLSRLLKLRKGSIISIELHGHSRRACWRVWKTQQFHIRPF